MIWTTYFHLLIILPAFCIAAAVLLENISQAIRRRRMIITAITSQKALLPLSLLSSSPFAITSAIGIFGLISSIMLITANHTLHNFVVFAFITQHLPDFKNTSNDDNNKVIMVGSLYLRSQYWLYKYVFNKDFDGGAIGLGDHKGINGISQHGHTTQKILCLTAGGNSPILSGACTNSATSTHSNTVGIVAFSNPTSSLMKQGSSYTPSAAQQSSPMKESTPNLSGFYPQGIDTNKAKYY
jgi:hypothetical protein